MAKEQLSAREHVFSVVVATLMILFTCCFCFTCFAHYHPELLRRVVFSFDFVFQSFQMMALHLSACDIFFWDVRAINVLLAVLWMHWILTIDAVTPVVRRKLGLYLHHTLPLMIILIGVHLTVVCELARGTKWRQFQFPTSKGDVMTGSIPGIVPAGQIHDPSNSASYALDHRRPCLFEVVEARPHPPVDMYKTLKRSLLGVAGARTYTRYQRRYGRILGLLYFPGWALSVATLFAPAPIGRWLAVLASFLQIPTIFMGIMSLRPDMIRELMTTYDFWFFSIMSIVKTVAMSLYYHDVRAFLCVVIWFGTQFTILVDAAISSMGAISISLFVSVGFNIAKLLLVSLELVPDTHSFEIFKYGLGLDITLFLYLNYVPEYPPVASVLAFVALGCSVVFCSVCFGLYHPGLLKNLCFSFDFVFLSSQLTTLHLAACDVTFWDSRAVVLATSLLWTHWVLTIDAFTPLAREKIGFQLWYCAPVLLTVLVGEATLMYETASGTRWHLQDRKLLTVRAFGRSIDVMVMPLLFTRIWMMLIWECRVVWRIYHARETDLIIIHGVVAFNLSKHPPSDMHLHVAQIMPSDTSALSDYEEAE
ncbi:hypothetical protein Poli38472_003443 [Pythium oligandrum]|uniref:Transmembrane protein n=1 Tax=Pythium oligandrum TaxID=41045 RepID=A0A8K1C774_PYTOL|nr:hypothetical protein Poli38472_003443 [Pythium oligandrum]|eukprot:TMW57518.1 hypothetical protein Poli38472_003443 [Pythium oligandrum]